MPRGNGSKRRADAKRKAALAPEAASAPKAASAPTVGAPIWASSPDDSSAASWVPLTPDEMKEKYGHLVIGVPYGLQYPMRWCPSDLLVAAEVVLAREPASSSSSTDPPAANAQSIPKRLQNCKMSKMALKQSRLRMETRDYLSFLYRRSAGLKTSEKPFSISFFNPVTGVTKLVAFGPGTLYTHLYTEVRSLLGVQKGSPMSMRIWDPYYKWVMTAPGRSNLHHSFDGKTFYCIFYRDKPDNEPAKYMLI